MTRHEEEIHMPGTITISYPKSGADPAHPTIVPGGGGFCLWGQANAAGALSAGATWSGGAAVGVLVAPNPLTPCTYGFTFANVDPSLSKIVTITVAGTTAPAATAQFLQMGPA